MVVEAARNVEAGQDTRRESGRGDTTMRKSEREKEKEERRNERAEAQRSIGVKRTCEEVGEQMRKGNTTREQDARRKSASTHQPPPPPPPSHHHHPRTH